MFELIGVTKGYGHGSTRVNVIDRMSLALEDGRSLGLLGRNGAGKSTLLRLLCGALVPDAGHIHRRGRVSWPVGIVGGLQAVASGRDNCRFVCRVQGYRGDALEHRVGFVREFSELGEHFERPVAGYSSGMRARLNFTLSLAFDFDCYLFDEIMAVGDQQFRDKAAAELRRRRASSSFVIASHNLHDIREHSDGVLVMQRGLPPRYFDDVQEGIHFYRNTYV